MMFVPDGNHLETPAATPVAEELLTGGRALQRAFLETRLETVGAGKTAVEADRQNAPVLLIRRGFAYRSYTLADGRRSIVDILIPGDIVGLEHAVGSRSAGELIAASVVSYHALEPAFLRRLMAEQSIALRVLSAIDEARSRVDGLAIAIGRLDAREKMIALLLNLHQRLRRRGLINGMTFNLPLTQEQIGDHLGLTLVHVNRTLRRLREEGLVIVDRQVVVIVNYDAMRAHITGIPGPSYIPNPVEAADQLLRRD